MSNSETLDVAAQKIADKLNGPHYRLGAAFRLRYLLTPPVRLFPSDHLCFADNGLIEQSGNLTPLGRAVRQVMKAAS